jgi:hypothetical protein
MLVAYYMPDTTQGKLCCVFGIFIGGICMGYIGTIGIQLIINPHRYSSSPNHLCAKLSTKGNSITPPRKIPKNGQQIPVTNEINGVKPKRGKTT